MADNPVPKSVGVIMDGNRRWAAAHGLPKLEGHRRGYEVLKEFARAAFDRGIENIFAFAFSTENWQRTEEEVSYLVKLLRWVLESELDEFIKEGVRLRLVGDRARFGEELSALMASAEEKTKDGKRGTMCILLSYGGRAEIVAATQKIIASGLKLEALDEKIFGDNLWTAGLPDPDLVIRTGGVERLSNFLSWQSAYSELFFTPTLWPDFTKEEFFKILEEYGSRERRFGR